MTHQSSWLLASQVLETRSRKLETQNWKISLAPAPHQPNAVKFDFATATRNFPPLWEAGSPLRQALNASIGKAISSSKRENNHYCNGSPPKPQTPTNGPTELSLQLILSRYAASL